MEIKLGIKTRLILFYIILLTVFGGTILILSVHIHRMSEISDNIVKRRYRTSSVTKAMLENLLSMEENKNKYNLLKKQEYRDYYISAQREYERNLVTIVELGFESGNSPWQQLYQNYQEHFIPTTGSSANVEPREIFWIPEGLTNEWIQIISDASLVNQQEVRREIENLNHRVNLTFRWGMLGLGISILLGLL